MSEVSKYNKTACPTFIAEMDNVNISLFQKKVLITMIKCVAMQYKYNQVKNIDGNPHSFKIKYTDFAILLGRRPQTVPLLIEKVRSMAKIPYVVNMIGKEVKYNIEDFKIWEQHDFDLVDGRVVPKTESKNQNRNVKIWLITDFDVVDEHVVFRLSAPLERAIESYSNKLTNATVKSSFIELDNNIINKIKSKFTLNLYILIMSYKGTFNTSGMDVEVAKKILGANSKTQKLSHFKTRVVDKSIEELKSDEIGIKVKKDFNQTGGVHFKILSIKKIVRANHQTKIEESYESEYGVEDMKDIAEAIGKMTKKKNPDSYDAYANTLRKKYFKEGDKSTIEAVGKVIAEIKKDREKAMLFDLTMKISLLKEETPVTLPNKVVIYPTQAHEQRGEYVVNAKIYGERKNIRFPKTDFIEIFGYLLDGEESA